MNLKPFSLVLLELWAVFTSGFLISQNHFITGVIGMTIGLFSVYLNFMESFVPKKEEEKEIK